MSQQFGSRGGKSIKRQVEAIKRRRMVSQAVVDLSDFRSLKRDSHQPTILAVDDEEIMRNAMKRILENEGYKVVLAEDAMALSKVLETIQLDLILLDINLPWVDGLELCTMLKRHPTLRQVPLVLVSGRRSREDVEKGFAAGCDDYITKPFELENMAQVVSKALGRDAV
jgi:CheY-like chemotaxis protein